MISQVDRPEPFSLVLIEALACDTPVLAYRRGAIPDIVDHGINGYLSDTLAEMVHTVAWAPNLDRSRCRETFEKRFTVKRMVQGYLSVYQRVMHTSNDQSADQGPYRGMRQFTRSGTTDAAEAAE